ncbi:MAG: 23S rRNA (pseudouridine(1915)-N(3))-methyltransferase RlmH [bacterium]|nr:23S rRNA (pseudouridine(1915)-N(3))-methyltransferase RlmH [Gemmatimonadota bacterium]HIL89646.1 23S rRNA (pseudouridine(1915)-N(3))-methyltransferase RlmH [Gemmatimonadota bacterium]
MKVQILTVGKVKGPFAQSVAEYEKRAARYWKLNAEEVSSGARGTSANPELVLKTEATRLLARISKELEVVALTRSGMTMNSRELARYLEQRALTASAGVAFIIGGAYGLGEGVLARAQQKLSLSPMTLPHQVARLVLSEQLYRAGTILRGEPYHKG